MFSKIEGGTCVNIQGLDCWLPPEGYVVNRSGELEHVGIYSRDEIASEQYWERKPLPTWYKKKIREEEAYEKKRKEDDPPYYDPDLDAYAQKEWHRRINGFWFMNNGKAQFITGAHYMFMQWWQLDSGYPKFRIPDFEYFCFLQYCIEDPECMGMLEITKRRFGKTFRGGLFLYDYPTRTKRTNGGIQSKTGADAKKVFAKAVISPFTKLPRFFRPEYDTTGGIRPKTEILFQQANVRGKKAETILDKDELESKIDWQSADDIAYDGQKIHRYFGDEWCKTTEANVYDRHEVIRYCLQDDEGRIIGKALYSSTVEKLETEKEGIQEAAKKLWEDSDQLKRQANGRTPSGLYRFFMTADRGRNFDIYGYPNVEKTVREILADRDSVKHNPRTLLKRIKKEARTIEEAFGDDDEDCIFNLAKINDRRAYLKANPVVHWRYLHFYRRIEDQKVSWRDVNPDDTPLCWKILGQLPEVADKNKYVYEDGFRKPGRTEIGVIGVDGYSNTQGGKVYGSKLSGWIFIKFDIRDPNNTGLFTGHIYGRPNEKDDMYNQILLAAEYLGFQVYFEFVADDYYTYFKNRGRLKYLGRFPKNSIAPEKLKKDKVERHYGFPTTEFALTKQNDAMLTYVEHHCDKIFYMELLDDLPKFRPYKRTPFDRTVSAMITLVSSMELTAPPPPRKTPLVTVYKNENYNNPQNVGGYIQKN